MVKKAEKTNSIQRQPQKKIASPSQSRVCNPLCYDKIHYQKLQLSHRSRLSNSNATDDSCAAYKKSGRWFLIDYSYNDSKWIIEIWAKSKVEAESRLFAIGKSGRVMGALP